MRKKTELLILGIKKTNWANSKIELVHKMKLYHNIFKPMIIYGYDIWYNEFEDKSTCINELKIIQNLILRSIKVACSRTNTNKLLESLSINLIHLN